MAGPTRTPQRDTRTPDSAREAQSDRTDEPTRHGDILGISDTPADVEIPQATDDRGGNPAGVELGPLAQRNLPRGKGATGIQMGAGESGTDIEPAGPRNSATNPDK